MAMLVIEYDRDVWKKFTVERIDDMAGHGGGTVLKPMTENKIILK